VYTWVITCISEGWENYLTQKVVKTPILKDKLYSGNLFGAVNPLYILGQSHGKAGLRSV